MEKKSVYSIFPLFLLALLFIVSGCTGTQSSGTATSGVEGLPPVPGYAGDIQDITVPTELKWDRSESMGIKTESFQGGIYVYKGNYSVVSLQDYMKHSMQDNKWKLVGETSSKDIMMAFVKPNKTCMMVLSEGDLLSNTKLTFYITIDQTAAASLNPFGEAVTQ